jgi:hypothetical protein
MEHPLRWWLWEIAAAGLDIEERVQEQQERRQRVRQRARR